MQKNSMYNDYYDEEVLKYLEQSINLLEKILKSSEFIFQNVSFKDSKDGRKDIRTSTILSLYREMIERIDGVFILLKNKSTLNSFILLRSFFEISIDLEKILKDNTEETAINYTYFKLGDYSIKLEQFWGINTFDKDNTEKKEKIKKEWEDVKNFSNIYNIPCLEQTHKKNIEKHQKQWWNYNKKEKSVARENTDNLLYKKLCMSVHGQNSLIDNFYVDNILNLRSLRILDDFGLIIYVITYKILLINELILNQCIKISLEEKKIKIEELHKYFQESEIILEKTKELNLKF
nr:DUF5677 domain-containing protein [uncultured Fusobacterium sp.]